MWGAALMGGQTTYSGTITNGAATLSGFAARGFNGSGSGVGPFFGSIAPSVIAGRTITRIYDIDSNSPAVAILAIAGFGIAPAQNWLVSIRVGAVTRFGVDASTFVSGGGVNAYSWSWNGLPFGLAGSGSTNFTIVTK